MLLYVREGRDRKLIDEDMCKQRMLRYLREHQPSKIEIELRRRLEVVTLPRRDRGGWSEDDHRAVRGTVNRIVKKLSQCA